MTFLLDPTFKDVQGDLDVSKRQRYHERFRKNNLKKKQIYLKSQMV